MTDSTPVADAPVDPFAYTAVTDLQYADADKVQINAMVTFTSLGTLPFTMCATDPSAHGAELYAAALAGTYGTIADYQAPAADVLEAQARYWRDSELTASQWLVERHRDQVEAGTATTLTADQYSALQVYRQALRDWPTVAGFPADSTRPTQPDWLSAAEAEADA